jgi:hypothetical protein
VAVLKGHRGNLGTRLSWHPHKLQILSSGADGTIRLWDAKTQQQLWVLQVLRDKQSIKFSPEGQMLAGDPAVFEREFRYIVEQPSGAMEIITPQEFQTRTRTGKTTQNK